MTDFIHFVSISWGGWINKCYLHIVFLSFVYCLAILRYSYVHFISNVPSVIIIKNIQFFCLPEKKRNPLMNKCVCLSHKWNVKSIFWNPNNFFFSLKRWINFVKLRIFISLHFLIYIYMLLCRDITWWQLNFFHFISFSNHFYFLSKNNFWFIFCLI